MAAITITGSVLGSKLTDLLNADNIEPGSEVSYQLAKIIYLYHPLGGKMVDKPVGMAMSQKRDISIPNGPEERVRDAFLKEWKALHCDDQIASVMTQARTYGVGSIIYGVPDVPTDEPIDQWTLADSEVYFNVLDPLNTAGSLILNQDPNSPDFQKVESVTAGGQPYHRSRACVVMNERPIYIAFSNSAFGYVGRSVYQRALFPLKSFVQTMMANDLVSLKAGVIVAKLKAQGSIVNNIMQKASAIKRFILREAQNGNVINIDETESIETLDLQNVNQAMSESRKNILLDVASAADMPAIILNDETFASGLSEGSEDAKTIARYVDDVRRTMEPLYCFFDRIVQFRAWNKNFYASIQRDYPEYADVDYETAFYSWVNSFTAEWPSYLIEPESEKVKVSEVKFRSIISLMEVLLPQADPMNKAQIIQWAADNMNEDKVMFTNPLIIDGEALANYVPPAPEPSSPFESAKGLPSL